MTQEQHEWYWKGYNDAKKYEPPHPMMDMPHDKKIAHAYGYHTPQREWTGLTWHDMPDEWVGKVAFMEGAKWAEKKLKERNT